MPHGDVDTFHLGGRWHNRTEGYEGVFASFDTKDEAVAAGREEARERQVEHIIRNLDGTIGERQFYGHDPRNIPGWRVPVSLPLPPP